MNNNIKNRIGRSEAISIIKSGKIVTVKFAKRSDDSVREINCRTGVNKYKKGKAGKGAAYSFKENGLISVFDLKDREYKAIPEERILSIKTAGRVLTVI